MTAEDLENMKKVDLQGVDRNSLVDLQEISIDHSLPIEQRVKDFVAKIKNPYCFKCGKYVVISKFSENGLSLEDCLKGILL